MISVIESEQTTFKKAKCCLLTMILLSVWDFASSIIFAIFVLYSDKAMCLNKKTQENILNAWGTFAAVYCIHISIYTIHRLSIYIIEYRKDKSFKITNNKCFHFGTMIMFYVISILWGLIIITAGICNASYSIYLFISIIYLSVQFAKEIIFMCIWHHHVLFFKEIKIINNITISS